VYSSLGKMDIVIDDKAGGGQIAVQTDHREADEIEAEWNVSVVFAAARARNPIRSGACSGVRFVFMNPPPERMKELTRKLGAELEVAPDSATSPGAADAGWVDRTVEAALLALGREVFEREGVEVGRAGLEKLEQSVLAELEGGPDSEFEIQYWTSVVELGAAVIVAIQKEYGGTISADEEMASLIPFRWDVNGGLINVFGRVERFLDEDATVLPSALLALLADQASAPEGEVMFTFRARDWAARDVALTFPLLQNADKLEGNDLPLLALVVDMPTSTKTIPRETAPDEIAKMRAEAKANLEKLPVEVVEVGDPASKILVVHGSYYAAEKLVDEVFMAGLAERLGSEMLMTSAPVRGRLFVQNGVSDPDTIGRFVGLVRKQHEDAPPQERISPAVMLVDKTGQLVGVARVSGGSAPLPPKKKSFWQRWFGGGEDQ
jgi:hypothetical protein